MRMAQTWRKIPGFMYVPALIAGSVALILQRVSQKWAPVLGQKTR